MEESRTNDEKCFKTYDEQIEILKQRGLQLEDESAKKILAYENYYKLINGYKCLFWESSTQTFKEGTTLNEIYNLYRFDRDLKGLLFRNILQMENTIKSNIAYVFSKNHGHKDFLRVDNFFGELEPITKLIADIHSEIAKSLSSKNSFITHYMSTYSYIPLWVLVKILTFGEMSNFYRCMKQTEKQDIAKLYGIRDNDLESYLSVMTLFRNVCAHDERLYKFKTKKRITNCAFHKDLNLVGAQGFYKNGTNDILAVLICFKKLLPVDDFDNFYRELICIISKLKLDTVGKSDVLNEMGLVSNWDTFFK